MTTEMDRWREIHEPAAAEEVVETSTVAIAVEEPPAPPIYALAMPTTTLQSYQAQTLSEARLRVESRRAVIAQREQAITEATEGLTAAEDANVFFQQNLWGRRLQGARSRLTKAKNALIAAEDFLTLIEDGYLPIPRLPAVEVHRLRDPLPVEALKVLKTEEDKGVFTEFAVVGGRDRFASRNSRRTVRGRDPILVGVCDGEMFSLAWWR